MNTREIRRIIERQKSGWTLELPFYVSPEIYEIERNTYLSEQWHIVGHISEVPRPGTHIVRTLLGQSLIILRDNEGVLRCLHNVCTHRGCRVVDHDGCTSGGFVCPYHAWSFRLDGSLKSAVGLPDDANTGTLGLRQASIRSIGGIILVSMRADPAELDGIERRLLGLLHHHGIASARIAARHKYSMRANWKLVIDNFLECYHCYPVHPEICAIRSSVAVQGRVATEETINKWARFVTQWSDEEADPSSPVPISSTEILFELDVLDVYRIPIGKGFKTESRDGSPVAPLMGKVKRYDGGSTGFCVQPFIYYTCCSDHAVLFQFDPAGPEQTDLTLTWLVDGSANEDSVDIDALTWMWDVTTKQDKEIIEKNFDGIRSMSYRPGPYSLLENLSSQQTSRYLSYLTRECEMLEK